MAEKQNHSFIIGTEHLDLNDKDNKLVPFFFTEIK